MTFLETDYYKTLILHLFIGLFIVSLSFIYSKNRGLLDRVNVRLFCIGE